MAAYNGKINSKSNLCLNYILEPTPTVFMMPLLFITKVRMTSARVCVFEEITIIRQSN